MAPPSPCFLGKGKATPTPPRKKDQPIETKGLLFISFGLFTDEKGAVIWRGPMLGGVLNQFLFDTAWGELDYLILDLPPGRAIFKLSLVQAVALDFAVAVTTPNKWPSSIPEKESRCFKNSTPPSKG